MWVCQSVHKSCKNPSRSTSNDSNIFVLDFLHGRLDTWYCSPIVLGNVEIVTVKFVIPYCQPKCPASNLRMFLGHLFVSMCSWQVFCEIYLMMALKIFVLVNVQLLPQFWLKQCSQITLYFV